MGNRTVNTTGNKTTTTFNRQRGITVGHGRVPSDQTDEGLAFLILPPKEPVPQTPPSRRLQRHDPQQLACHALTSSLNQGLRKVQVEIAADDESAIKMFSQLGFTGEALLRDHIRARDGQYHDLVLLAHLVDDTWTAMNTVGITEELAD